MVIPGRSWFVLVLLLVMAAPGLGACTSSDEGSPRGAVQAYFDAWNTRDVDLILSHLADDAAVEVDSAGVIVSGRDEIRAAFEQMFDRSEWTIEISDFEVDGNTVTYNFEIRSPDGVVLDRGRSQATVQNGLVEREQMVGAFRE
jgi:ketosteroid isomerase-like protein